MLETRGLCKSFGALEVAREVSFRLERGARHALIGPNGAGKTTFVNLLTHVLARLREEGNLAIVLVEQNSRVALDFCERTVVMDRGQIVYDGPAERLRGDPETLASLIAAQ